MGEVKTDSERIEELLATWQESKIVLGEWVERFAEALVPVWESIVETVTACVEVLEREQLRHSLSRWLPDILASWLASHCPRRLLPKLKLEEVEDV